MNVLRTLYSHIIPASKTPGFVSVKGDRRVKAFTLIELLIVVAIIAILAAIAVPNFLEAQTRAKVSRARADMRTLKTGLEAYRIDNNNYPLPIAGTIDQVTGRPELYMLTTPVAYLTSLYKDPFPYKGDTGKPWYDGEYEYVRYQQEFDATGVSQLHFSEEYQLSKESNFLMISCGPDLRQSTNYGNDPAAGMTFSDGTYDPTNGTISFGDIFSTGSAGSAK